MSFPETPLIEERVQTSAPTARPDLRSTEEEAAAIREQAIQKLPPEVYIG